MNGEKLVKSEVTVAVPPSLLPLPLEQQLAPMVSPAMQPLRTEHCHTK